MIAPVALYRSSKYRQKVLSCLKGKTMTPSEISEQVGIRLNLVSMVLTKLKENGLATCLNEQNKRGRLYELTELGEKVVSHENGNSN